MRRIIFHTVMVFFSIFVLLPAFAQDLIIYPAKGQGQEQMEKDKYECYTWAKGQSGFDPMVPQQTAQAPQPQGRAPGGERVRGAARGALIGAVVGEIANDDAGKGAAAGAAGGAIAGGMRKRRRMRREAQAAQHQQQVQTASYEEKRSTYNRAYSACLEAKGYTVK